MIEKITKQPCKCGAEGELIIDKNRRFNKNDLFIKCTRCGRKTDYYSMPWEAWEQWNNHNYKGMEQITIFDL